MARRILVTGAASGIGLETALQLAARDHHVILADRNVAGGEAALRRIVEAGGNGEFRRLDLADLACIRQFASDELAQDRPLDVLIENAGLLPPVARATTRDGFELAFGVAYLGHFALTGLLLRSLERSPAPRVVSVASIAHAYARIDLDDLQRQRGYSCSSVYGSTKLACLMFAFELHRRAKLAGSTLTSVAAHPGVCRTPIGAGWDRETRRGVRDRCERFAYHVSMRLFGRSAAEGARSIVYAATESTVVGGGYYGPVGLAQTAGAPGRVRPSRRALDERIAARLWEASERLTGVRYEWPASLAG